MKKSIDFGDPFYNEMHARAVQIFGAQSVTVPDVQALAMEINDGRIFVRVTFGHCETKVYFSSVPASLITPAPYSETKNLPFVLIFDRPAAFQYLEMKKAESNFLKANEG